MTIQMKATEQYFPVVQYIMLQNEVLPFQSVKQTLSCDPMVSLQSASFHMIAQVVLQSKMQEVSNFFDQPHLRAKSLGTKVNFYLNV